MPKYVRMWEMGYLRYDKIYSGNTRLKKSRKVGQKQTPQRFCGVLFIPGGDEGIRTLDTLAGILHFQCSALDQLCDVSVSGVLYYSADKSAVSSVSSGSIGSSINVFSNSASISRVCGSSTFAISKESSPSDTAGFSLYDCTNS